MGDALAFLAETEEGLGKGAWRHEAASSLRRVASLGKVLARASRLSSYINLTHRANHRLSFGCVLKANYRSSLLGPGATLIPRGLFVLPLARVPCSSFCCIDMVAMFDFGFCLVSRGLKY